MCTEYEFMKGRVVFEPCREMESKAQCQSLMEKISDWGTVDFLKNYKKINIEDYSDPIQCLKHELFDGLLGGYLPKHNGYRLFRWYRYDEKYAPYSPFFQLMTNVVVQMLVEKNENTITFDNLKQLGRCVYFYLEQLDDEMKQTESLSGLARDKLQAVSIKLKREEGFGLWVEQESPFELRDIEPYDWLQVAINFQLTF